MIDHIKTIRSALQAGIRAINHLGGAKEAMPLHYALTDLDALEAENARLKDLLGKANTLARIRWERLCQLQGRSINEDNSDHHGPDWTERESEYLK